MQDATNSFDDSLANLGRREWQARLIALADQNGMHQLLGKRHFATFINGKDTLLVTFETTQGIRSLSQTAQPFGFEMVRALGWSTLSVMSDGDTWFRDANVYDFFDQLIDDGFFDEFETVVFYGAGPCGYSAAAFSVVSPGATVLAIQPQATLDPEMSEWDDRFPEMRRTSFRDRFGFAPDMLDAAARAFVIYDPRQELDAMHATLFSRPNVTRLKMPGMGGALQTQLIEMDMLYPLLTLTGTGKLTAPTFYDLYRARRDNMFYLNGLRGVLEREKRFGLLAVLCRNVVARLDAPKFGARLEELEEMADAGEFRMPGLTKPVPAE